MDDFYFGFGSNLGLRLQSRPGGLVGLLQVGRIDPAAMTPVGPATLRGEMLVFADRSIRRQCGAFSIRRVPGASVEG